MYEYNIMNVFNIIHVHTVYRYATFCMQPLWRMVVMSLSSWALLTVILAFHR